MVNQGTPVRRWNIFARELEDILAARGVRLEDLDNHLPVLPEKVRLLSQSLLRSSQTLGGGTHFCLAHPVPTAQFGL